MNLLEHYQRNLSSGEMLEDSQQIQVIQKLQQVYDTLTIPKKSWLPTFTKNSSKGVYLWGNVGIGKTFLMDLFYHQLPFDQKYRTHFLPFMREIHVQLNHLQGIKNPLLKIAQDWAARVRVICFDEFLVNDIADASILGGLLAAFFSQDICMVFTSNFEPDDLYKNGIQRHLFLPTIEKIKHETAVIHLETISDYRDRYPIKINHYCYPLTVETQAYMESAFSRFSTGISYTKDPLIINDREIYVEKISGKIVWFDFLAICGVPRSQNDYLDIVEKFEMIFISNLRQIRANENNLVRSFIQLIDVLYIARTKLIISAALPIEKIYENGELAFEFKRTLSRLTQMQSAQWMQGKCA